MKNIVMSMHITPEQREILRKVAADRNMTMSAVIQELLESLVKDDAEGVTCENGYQ